MIHPDTLAEINESLESVQVLAGRIENEEITADDAVKELIDIFYTFANAVNDALADVENQSVGMSDDATPGDPIDHAANQLRKGER